MARAEVQSQGGFPSKEPHLHCPECGSKRFFKAGFRYLLDGNAVQRWLCRSCGYRFSEKGPQGSTQPLRKTSDVSQHVSIVASKSLKAELAILVPCRVGASGKEAKNLEEEATRQEWAAGATATIDAKTEFAEQLKRDGYSQDTIRQCVHYLRLFEKKSVNILNPEQVKAFIAEQKWQTHSKATAVTMYNVFAKYMHLQWTLPRYRYDQKIPFIPTEKEVDDLIAGTGKKTSMLLRLLKETGARLTEALRIKSTDVDLTKGTVTIDSPGKKSLPWILKASSTLMATLNTLPRESDYVLSRTRNTAESNYRMQRNRLAQKLGNPRLKQIHLHTFRHFYATMLYAKTLNILKVQQALGHKNINNTMLYTHMVNFDGDEYNVQVAENLEEAKKLLEVGFDYVTDMDSRKLFRKRK